MRSSHARLVSQGYSQVPEIDFSKNFAPVIDNTTFRAVLSLIQKEKITVYALDVQTAFLHGESEEEIFMKIPEGYTEDQEFYEMKALNLNKAIYGLVQAAR
jgi:hypothetical protein